MARKLPIDPGLEDNEGIIGENNTTSEKYGLDLFTDQLKIEEEDEKENLFEEKYEKPDEEEHLFVEKVEYINQNKDESETVQEVISYVLVVLLIVQGIYFLRKFYKFKRRKND